MNAAAAMQIEANCLSKENPFSRDGGAAFFSNRFEHHQFHRLMLREYFGLTGDDREIGTISAALWRTH
jgi:hypothetical protein